MKVAPQVAELRELLGNDVLLLPWPLGKKGDKRAWKHLTAAAMNDPAHLRLLGRGNIGVALGQVSGGLCSLDIDSDEELAHFLELNPEIGNTLQSRGSRGGNLWWRIADPVYPRLKPLKRYEKGWGEWRSTGSQTIIYGQHPDGHNYQIVNRVKPITIELIQIQWPEGIYPLLQGGSMGNDTERTETTELTERSETPERTEANRSGIVSEVCVVDLAEIDSALDISVPKQPHENHKCLFTLARAVKAFELRQNRKWTIQEMRSLFLRWHERARPFLRQNQNKDDYWFEFLEAYDNADHPLGVDIIASAWDLAQGKEFPEVARQFETDNVRLLVSLCRELQALCGDKPFFLASRTVQRLFELDSHATGARWLKGLCRSGILKVVEQGGRETNKATRFRYLPPI